MEALNSKSLADVMDRCHQYANLGGYYRENPDVFAEEYLHLQLKWFQKMLLKFIIAERKLRRTSHH